MSYMFTLAAGSVLGAIGYPTVRWAWQKFVTPKITEAEAALKSKLD